jgi:AcrR family transcriptional regulator
VAETRLRILDAAARLFREKGFAGTSQRDIATACEMQPGSLYYHFASKDEVLAEVLDLGILRVIQGVEAALAGLEAEASPRERLRVAIAAHLETLFHQGDYTSAHFRIWKLAPPEIQRRNLVLRDRYEAIWVGLLEAMKEAGTFRGDVDLRVLRLFLFGAMNWTLDWYQERDLTLTELAEMYTDFLLRGVGPAGD